METHKSQFNRNLAIILLVLYLLTITVFVFLEWAAEPQNSLWWMVFLNILILSIPLVLLYGSLYVLVLGWREHSTLGQVRPPLAKFIHWAPRIAAMLIIFFMSLFSLDVFGEGASPLRVLGAFLMHNIPSLVMILFLAFAWRRPVVGFVVFLITAVAFVFFFVRSIYALSNLLLFVFPILLIAFLFYADWQWLESSGTA